MSVTATVVNNLTMSSQGSTITAKQGTSTDDFDEGYDITATGDAHKNIGTLATATIRKIYDDDTHFPVDPIYWHFWADGNCYLQWVGSGTNFIVPVASKVPFVLYGHTLLAAADTTDITGASEPTLTDIDHLILGNYSGSTINYVLTIIY